jgi:lipopolysaccharide biosynthesis glycosyltransferase
VDYRIMLYTNSGACRLLLNLLEAMKQQEISNYVIFCADNEAYQLLSEKGHPCETVEMDESIREFHCYGSTEFNQLTYHKLHLAKELLSAGTDVLMMDADIVILRDPVEEVRMYYDTADIFIQRDGEMDENMCTGFVYFRNTEYSHRYLDACEDLYRYLMESGRIAEFNDPACVQSGIFESGEDRVEWGESVSSLEGTVSQWQGLL